MKKEAINRAIHDPELKRRILDKASMDITHVLRKIHDNISLEISNDYELMRVNQFIFLKDYPFVEKLEDLE